MTELTGSIHTIRRGDSVDVEVAVIPTEPVAGLQFDMSWDPAVVRLTGVTEGDFLKQNNQSSFFRQPDIAEGSVIGVAGAILGGTVDGPGVFATLHFEALESGETELVLSNVIIADAGAQPIAVDITPGRITVRLPWDVNLDGEINILDLILVAQHWGSNGSYDVNQDQVVDVRDLVAVAQMVTPIV